MKFFTTCGLLLLSAAALAQTAPPAASPPTTTAPTDSVPRYWATSLKAGLNANEALLSDNWKGGGVSSVGLSLLFNGKANYHHGPHSWDNEADFLYAGQVTQGQGYRKTNDRLWLDTKYGRDLTRKWSVFVALNLLSQFGPGYDYSADRPRLISGFLAPAYVTNSYGVEFHPSTRFKLRLSPFAPRLTVVRDIARYQTIPTDVIYGVDPGHSTRWEILAAQVLAELDQPLGPNANLKARYLLFANYETLTLEKINHRLDLTLTAKVNSLLNVSLGGIVLYDYSQDATVQYSQNLALGILFNRNRPATVPR